MQLAVAGCLRALSGRDELVSALLNSHFGHRWLRLAISGECRIVLSLPEVQRYLSAKWRGLELNVDSPAALAACEEWALGVISAVVASRRESSRNPGGAEVFTTSAQIMSRVSIRHASDGSSTTTHAWPPRSRPWRSLALTRML